MRCAAEARTRAAAPPAHSRLAGRPGDWLTDCNIVNTATIHNMSKHMITSSRHASIAYAGTRMAMDNDTAELLLAGVRQVADDVPGLGPHARPSQMSKKGFLVDLRDNHTRSISDQQTKASIQQEARNR